MLPLLLRVYGRIRVTEKQSHSFDIYHRTADNPQSTVSGDALFLIPPLDPKNDVIVPSKDVSLIIKLFDRACPDKPILNGKIILDRTKGEDWLEDYPKEQRVYGENNLYAEVDYVVFPYAVAATVSVLFFSKDDDFDSLKETPFFDKDTDCVYHIPKLDPQDCPDAGMLVIVKGPSRNNFDLLDDLAIFLRFKDASRRGVICRGFVPFRNANIDYYFANRRVCSVFRGELGFAAVHYSIIPSGVSTKVAIKLNGICRPSMVKGEICARYGNCEPSRCYQEKFFKNFLFYDEHDGTRLDDFGFTLPLLKSVVALPIDSYLIIEAELSVGPVDGNLAQGAQSLKGSVKFWNTNDCPRRIGNEGDLYLDVFVEFSTFG